MICCMFLERGRPRFKERVLRAQIRKNRLGIETVADVSLVVGASRDRFPTRSECQPRFV
jgi:hypothetical protein